MGPLSRLSFSQSAERCVRPPNCAGISPLKWLDDRSKLLSWLRLPSSAGMGPLKRLDLNCRSARLTRLPNCGGMVPFNWLKSRNKKNRFVRLPNCAGIVPPNWLLFSASHSSLVRFPSCGGLEPLRLLPSRINWMTCPSPQVTPNQLHGVSVSNQPLLSAQLAPFALLYRATSAKHSVAGIAPCAAQPVKAAAAGFARTAWFGSARKFAAMTIIANAH